MNDETVTACQNVAWRIGRPGDRGGVTSAVTEGLPRFGSICICNLYPAFAKSLKKREATYRGNARERL